MKRESYAKRLLQVVESIATVFPSGKALEPHLKVADAVLDGVESLLGMGDTKPLAGHRWEYNDGVSPWLKPGFFALIDTDEANLDPASLRVEHGRLRAGAEQGARGFRAADYLLYSLRTLANRTDVSELPFHRMFQRALHDAGSADEGSWDRAKAGLVTLYQEMLTSPDLIWSQIQQLTNDFTQRLKEAHERAKSFSVLGCELESSDAGIPDAMFAPFRGTEAQERLGKLHEIHKLLDLE